MKKRSVLCAWIAMSPAILSPAAWVDEAPAIGSFGASVSSNGLGIDYARAIHRKLDLRIGYDFGTLSRDSVESGIDYDVEFKFSAVRLLADLKPFGGGFRISAGLYTGSPELELEAEGLAQYTLGERAYIGDLQVLGDIDLGGAAPYFGIGWGGTAGTTGFGASFDLGALFTRSPAVQLSVPRGRACDASASPCDPNGASSFDVNDPNNPQAATFRDNVMIERQQLEDDADDYRLWPVIRLGLHYRF